MRRIAVTACVLAIVLSGGPAIAGQGDGQVSNDGSSTVKVEIGYDTPPGLTPKGENILAGCNAVTPLDPDHLLEYLGATGQHLAPFDPANPPEDTFFHFVSCPTPAFANRDWHVWEIGEPAPPVVVNAVARHAYNQTQVPLPLPESSPPGTLDHPLIVNMETWYWTDATLWAPVSVTAEIPEFGISVTATATPSESVWNPGDQSAPITCTHGTAWTLGQPTVNPDCSHHYEHKTPADQPFTLTATTTWTITYACQPAGYCPLPPTVPGSLTTIIERPIWATEIKGIITR